MRSPYIVVALLLAACGSQVRTFGADATGGTPPALPAGWDVPQFDHFCGGVQGSEGWAAKLAGFLDEASKEGWELVAVSDGLFCFKRPLDLDPSSPSLSPPAPPAG